MTRHSIHDVQHPTAENPDDGIVASAIDLTKVYGSKDNEVMALDHVNVEFKRGEMTAIMGPSGSGKSTLMHCMAGLDAPSSGKVMVEGLEVSSMNQKQLTDLRREQIGFIFQSFNLVPTLSAEENILLPLQIAKRTIDRDWFNQVVKVVGLEKRLTHRPSQLSGGQQQRVACARAIMARPSVIFADEPTTKLTPSAMATIDMMKRPKWLRASRNPMRIMPASPPSRSERRWRRRTWKHRRCRRRRRTPQESRCTSDAACRG